MLNDTGFRYIAIKLGPFFVGLTFFSSVNWDKKIQNWITPIFKKKALAWLKMTSGGISVLFYDMIDDMPKLCTRHFSIK